MRHLRVPKRATQDVLAEIRAHFWAPRGLRILSYEDDNLIPLGDEAPDILPISLQEFAIVEAEQPIPPPRIWSDHLSDFLDEETILTHKGLWPNAQEPLGDILIFKIDHLISDYAQQVALAKLTHHKKLRAVFRDHGVDGRFRIRKLEALAVRNDSEILDASEIAQLGDEEKERLLSTQLTIQEFGLRIAIDPSEVYYSPRLQGERQKSAESASCLQEILGRPIDVADPYCGVGPALVHLLAEDGLIGGFLASDLNPAAIPHLSINLEYSGVDTTSITSSQITEITPSRWAGCADALTLSDDERFRHKFDMLLVNIPHDTVDHLPSLLPLLRKNSPVVVRGWLVAADSELAEIERRLQQLLTPPLAGHPAVEIERRRQYSAADWLCRFEAWLKLPE